MQSVGVATFKDSTALSKKHCASKSAASLLLRVEDAVVAICFNVGMYEEIAPATVEGSFSLRSCQQAMMPALHPVRMSSAACERFTKRGLRFQVMRGKRARRQMASRRDIGSVFIAVSSRIALNSPCISR